jgi:hypothetical protein
LYVSGLKFKLEQFCGSGSALVLVGSIRILIQASKIYPQKNEKNTEMQFYEVLDFPFSFVGMISCSLEVNILKSFLNQNNISTSNFCKNFMSSNLWTYIRIRIETSADPQHLRWITKAGPISHTKNRWKTQELFSSRTAKFCFLIFVYYATFLVTTIPNLCYS